MNNEDRKDAAVCWHVGEHILMRVWNGEVVAYDDVTGNTHHFMDVAAWVLERLSGRAMADADLTAAAATELQPAVSSDLATSVRNALALFQRLGFLEGESAG